jgi:mannose-1-phosphate guanylyltransferase/mannose-6-phosphate isomerase
MISVIIAGGSGTRLWPLSTPDYPKHLLNITGDQTLVQAAYDRALRLAESADKVYVITEASHDQHVREQLSQLPEDHFLIEPARRGTSSCMLAAMRLVQQHHAKDEAVAVLWADHCIRDVEGFTQSFRRAGDASQQHNRAVLVGIEPTYPSTGLGYIHKAAPLDDAALVYNVASFKEKPQLPQAQEFFHSGEYLWNGGYVVTTVYAFEAALDQYCPDLKRDYESLMSAANEDEYKERYLALQSIALDYTFNEHVENLLVVPANFDWIDLGSFKDMYDFLDHDENGNMLKGRIYLGEEVENAFVRNDEEKPVAVIGVNNIVVVNTPTGILVARKDLAQKVGEISKQIQAEDKEKENA